MAASYYAPPRPRSISRTSSAQDGSANARAWPEPIQPTPHDIISTDQPIYIFPSPPSDPPTPATSVSSAPTDFDFSLLSDSRSTSRARLHRQDSTLAPRRGSSGSAAYAALEESFRHDGLPTPSEEELEAELWDISDDPVAEFSESDESWALCGEGDHAGVTHRFDQVYDSGQSANIARRPSTSRQRSLDRHIPQLRIALRPVVRRRSRTRSRLRTISVSSSASSSMTQTAPHPRIHLPFLRFFASLLFIDLDDPALRLLTAAEPEGAEAILFPGQSSARLLYEDRGQGPRRRQSLESDSDAETDSSIASDVTPHDEPAAVHGLPRLLLANMSDTSAVALRSLRAGLAVQIQAASDIALPSPPSASLLGLWRVLGEVCSRGSQAWKEVWITRSSMQREVRSEDT
ncbi:hypothetical protein OH77DRAFT_1425520 [Trametes cingulata]|nr:hypothetical protein OH77DRAFT_1425520 [Trametes cingulata]